MTKKQPILIVGRSGQLAQALAYTGSNREDLVFRGSADHDFFDAQATKALLAHLKPACVINTAAYTNVDGAESDEDDAHRLNAELPQLLAELLKPTNTPLIHVSTDYVFDGEKDGTYTPEDATNPINAYGRTKLAGEHAIQAGDGPHQIVRTAWVVSRFGKNFAKTMVRLMQEKPELGIVADQHGTPTSAVDLALYLLELADTYTPTTPSGVLHFSSAPKQSWFDLATLIHTHLSDSKNINCQLRPITTAEFPTPAKRATNTALEVIKVKDRLPGLSAELIEICG